jgi:hypothetical protein
MPSTKRPVPAPAQDELFTLEADQRLSRSLLWQAQRAFFQQRGIEAWRTGAVPHYITNNPALAHAYAEVVLGFLRDGLDATGLGRIDPSEPVTIVELGAGSGRFGYLFSKALRELQRHAPHGGAPVRYVMTDVAQTSLDFWRSHPALQPLVKQGVLDFAAFDLERDHEIRLCHDGAVLGPGALRNPLIVIANYVFDSIPQDAFSVREGQLHEGLISITSRAPEIDLAAVAPFAPLTLSYRHRPAEAEYYGDPALDEILRDRAARPGDATFLFPCAAIRSIRRFASLSRGGLLLLSGDREARDDAQASPPDPTGFAVHGSFSFPVDHHAIGEHFRRNAGHVLRTRHRPARLDVVAFLLGKHPAGYPETRLAFTRSIEQLGPDDFFIVRRGIQDHYGSLNVDQILALVRMSRHDPRVLRDCLPALKAGLDAVSSAMKDEVARTALRVWENYYHLDEEGGLSFELGLLLHAAGAHREALSLVQIPGPRHGGEGRA